MSVIAWDGQNIAADKQATCAGMRITTTKLKRLESGEVVGYTADQDSAEAVVSWYANGADPTKWPTCQADKEAWARLIVFRKDGIYVYERQPFAVKCEDKFMAWGSGRDYAMGAMARGATARQAVEAACLFDTSCGMGIDEEKL